MVFVGDISLVNGIITHLYPGGGHHLAMFFHPGMVVDQSFSRDQPRFESRSDEGAAKREERRRHLGNRDIPEMEVFSWGNREKKVGKLIQNLDFNGDFHHNL